MKRRDYMTVDPPKTGNPSPLCPPGSQNTEIAGVNWESGYLVGIKRQRRLYCNVGIGFHLQVPPDGRISGTHEENPYSECQLQPVGTLGGLGSCRAKR